MTRTAALQPTEIPTWEIAYATYNSLESGAVSVSVADLPPPAGGPDQQD